MKIEQFTFGPFGTNTYVLTDEDGKVLLIDPACFYEQERQVLYQTITRLHQPDQPLTIVATHGHLDHLWGAKWATETWHTPVRMHEADIPMAQAMQQQYDLFGVQLKAERFEISDFRLFIRRDIRRGRYVCIFRKRGSCSPATHSSVAVTVAPTFRAVTMVS